MTKEEAIRILASSCIPGSKQTEALETLIPELRESEDERIRKAIYDFFSLAGNAYDLYGIPKANLLAYLEKQKDEEGYEAIPVESTLEYKLGFKAGRDPEKQKEQKPSINIDQLKSLMLQYLQEAANEKDDLDIEADTDKWARKILGYDFEQKPADLSEMMVHKEPYIAPVPTPMVADEQKSVKYGDDVVEEAEEYTSKVDCGEYGAEVTEAYIAGVLAERNRKPAEWSEDELAKRHLEGYIMGREDTMREMKDFIESHFNTNKAREGEDLTDLYRKEYAQPFPIMPTPPSGWGCDGTHCTNPQMDCINCPRKTTGGVFSPSSGTSTATLHGNTSATDGKPHNPSFID